MRTLGLSMMLFAYLLMQCAIPISKYLATSAAPFAFAIALQTLSTEVADVTGARLYPSIAAISFLFGLSICIVWICLEALRQIEQQLAAWLVRRGEQQLARRISLDSQEHQPTARPADQDRARYRMYRDNLAGQIVASKSLLTEAEVDEFLGIVGLDPDNVIALAAKHGVPFEVDGAAVSFRMEAHA